MNERIQQLAEQCRIETYGVNGELLAFGFDEEKFAELIVGECIDNVKVWEKDSRNHISYMLKRHFGVEE